MADSLDAIRAKIGAYLVRKIDLADFETWFASATWDLEDPIIDKVDALLVRFGVGDLDETALRAAVRKLVVSYRIEQESPALVFSTGAPSPQHTNKLSLRTPSRVGKQLQTVSG